MNKAALKCAACNHEYFISFPRRPFILPCGHTQCETCLMNKQLTHCKQCNCSHFIHKYDETLDINYYITGIETERLRRAKAAASIAKVKIDNGKAKEGDTEKAKVNLNNSEKMAEKYPKQMSFSCSKCAIFTLTVCNDCDAFYCKNCFNQAHSSIGIDAAHRLSELNRKTMMKGTEMKFCKAHERDVNAGISSDSSFLRDPSCLWCQCIENDDTENSCDNHQYDKTITENSEDLKDVLNLIQIALLENKNSKKELHNVRKQIESFTRDAISRVTELFTTLHGSLQSIERDIIGEIRHKSETAMDRLQANQLLVNFTSDMLKTTRQISDSYARDIPRPIPLLNFADSVRTIFQNLSSKIECNDWKENPFRFHSTAESYLNTLRDSFQIVKVNPSRSKIKNVFRTVLDIDNFVSIEQAPVTKVNDEVDSTIAINKENTIGGKDLNTDAAMHKVEQANIDELQHENVPAEFEESDILDQKILNEKINYVTLANGSSKNSGHEQMKPVKEVNTSEKTGSSEDNLNLCPKPAEEAVLRKGKNITTDFGVKAISKADVIGEFIPTSHINQAAIVEHTEERIKNRPHQVCETNQEGFSIEKTQNDSTNKIVGTTDSSHTESLPDNPIHSKDIPQNSVDAENSSSNCIQSESIPKLIGIQTGSSQPSPVPLKDESVMVSTSVLEEMQRNLSVYNQEDLQVKLESLTVDEIKGDIPSKDNSFVYYTPSLKMTNKSFTGFLIMNEPNEVKISYLKEPSFFFVQPKRFLDQQARFQEMIDNSVATNKNYPSEKITMLNIYLIKVERINKWCRGKPIKTLADANMWLVFFIDYGFQEAVHSSRIYGMPLSLMLSPNGAIICSLYGIKPAGYSWLPGATQLFAEMVNSSKRVLLMVLQPDFRHKMQVDLLVETGDGKRYFSIREALLFSNNAVVEKIRFNVDQQEFLKKKRKLCFQGKDIFKESKLQPNETFEIKMLDIISAKHFYGIKVNQVEVYKSLQERINHYYNTNIIHRLYSPGAGMTCIVHVGQDWLRGLIRYIRKTEKCEVFLMDCGEMIVADWTQLFLLSKEFTCSEYICGAIKFRLDGVSDGGEHFSNQAIRWLEKICKNASKIRVKVVGTNPNAYAVGLYVKKTLDSDELYVNEFLIAKIRNGKDKNLKQNVANEPISKHENCSAEYPVESSINCSVTGSEVQSIAATSKEITNCSLSPKHPADSSTISAEVEINSSEIGSNVITSNESEDNIITSVSNISEKALVIATVDPPVPKINVIPNIKCEITSIPSCNKFNVLIENRSITTDSLPMEIFTYESIFNITEMEILFKKMLGDQKVKDILKSLKKDKLKELLQSNRKIAFNLFATNKYKSDNSIDNVPAND